MVCWALRIVVDCSALTLSTSWTRPAIDWMSMRRAVIAALLVSLMSAATERRSFRLGCWCGVRMISLGGERERDIPDGVWLIGCCLLCVDTILAACDRNNSGMVWVIPPLKSRGEHDCEVEELRENVPMVFRAYVGAFYICGSQKIVSVSGSSGVKQPSYSEVKPNYSFFHGDKANHSTVLENASS